MGIKSKFHFDGVEISSSVSNEEAKNKTKLEGGKNHGTQTFSSPTSGPKKNEAEGGESLKQEEHKHRKDFVTNSPQENSWNNATESKGLSLFANQGYLLTFIRNYFFSREILKPFIII